MTITQRSPDEVTEVSPLEHAPTQGAPAHDPADAVVGAPTLRQRLRSGAVRAVAAATTPLLPADYLDVVAPLHSAQLRGRIEEIRPETSEAATVVVRPGRGWQGHIPGQYVRFGVDVDGVRLWRAYSVNSGPRTDGRIAVTVKVIPEGKVSNYLVHRARPGTIVQMDPATGEFHLPAIPPRKVLFVTAGSGITPVMGMLRHHVGLIPDIVLVHSAPTADRVIFGDELRSLAEPGRLRLVERHTDVEGVLTPDELERLVPDLRQRHTWACGPTRMLDDLAAHFEAGGIPDRLHTERFRPQIIATGDGGTVSFVTSERTVEADAATPLLEAGEGAGVLMPSGCRMGICFNCVAPLRSGAVRDLRTGAVTTAVAGDGVKIQTCINAAAGPCEIEL